MRRRLIALAVALSGGLLQTGGVLACGGLVAPDGDVRLDKATTFVAWRSGVEHYVTSFAYRGSAVDVGWIVPLPAIPSRIEAAGRWTLQRLEREFSPPAQEAGSGSDLSAASAVVVEQVQVEALDVTVLKGSGAAVIDWCAHNGFALDAETRAHLLRYAAASPVFMAAKYNTSAAQRRGLQQGDGVPLMLTMPTGRLWLPLEVLANDGSQVRADLFLLTDQRLSTADPLIAGLLSPGLGSGPLPGVPGFTLQRDEPMRGALRADLAGDRHMGWLPQSRWLTYLTLDASSDTVNYDLSVDDRGIIRLPLFGSKPAAIAAPAAPALAVAAVVLCAGGLAPLAAWTWKRRYRRSALTMSRSARPSSGSMPSTRQ